MVKGKLHSKGDVPFETEGTIEATKDGQIRIQAQKIKAVKVPVKGLMDLLGLKLADLINTKRVAGVRVDGTGWSSIRNRFYPRLIFKVG